MDLQTYGRHLVDELAERSLRAIRGTNIEELKQWIGLASSSRARPLAQAGAAIGAFAAGAAIGAGITALYTPTTGPELRKKLNTSARDARKQAMQLRGTVRSQLGDARGMLAERVEKASSAVGLASPLAARRRTKRKANGASRRKASGPSRRSASSTSRDHA